ncbi:uncharacterized protein [Elaeis guineensis]|uniref:uncharacterized protein n=1 Tax=Elaeis guineensis var. tenera TaxID=51953 RepID=UPI003C6D7A0C
MGVSSPPKRHQSIPLNTLNRTERGPYMAPPQSPAASHFSPSTYLMASVRDVLIFHKQEIRLFDMLKARTPSFAQRILALWLWLELLGINVVAFVCNCRNRDVVHRLIDEALQILDQLRQNAPLLTEDNGKIPLTAALAVEPFNLRFFHYHRDRAVTGIAHILDGVGKLIFDENLHALLGAYESGALPELPEELARPYHHLPAVPAAPADARSLFLTFSPAFPLSREDIVVYFTRRWGRCVESVTLENEPGLKPMYGLVVFTSESFVGLVVSGERTVRFMINGKPLWARNYGNQ